MHWARLIRALLLSCEMAIQVSIPRLFSDVSEPLLLLGVLRVATRGLTKKFSRPIFRRMFQNSGSLAFTYYILNRVNRVSRLVPVLCKQDGSALVVM